MLQIAPALPVGGNRPRYDNHGSTSRGIRQNDIKGQTYLCDLSDKED